MVDLVVSMGITSLLLATSVISLRSNFTDLGVAAQTVTSELRKTRMNAQTRGAHYRMTLASGWFKSERLQDTDNDGVWQVDTGYPSLQRNFEGGVSMVANTGNVVGTAPVVEFDTRGMIVPQAGSTVPNIVTVTINGSTDTNAMHGTLYVYLWPSGQVGLRTSGEVHP
jgi:hypothetical protein